VLDVATGRGALLFPAALKVASTQNRRIDFSSDMVRETTIDIRRAGCANAEVHEMDAEILISDQSFTLCSAVRTMVLSHPDRALREFFRVLKPGGRLSLTTWAKDSPIQNLYRKHLVPMPSDRSQGTEFYTFGTTDSIESAVDKRAFSHCSWTQRTPKFIYTSEDEPWRL